MFKRLTILLAATALAATSAMAAAQETPNVEFFGFNYLPYQQVAVELSQPGETLDAFVVRLAPLFDQFTAKTEWEACGELAQDAAGRYALVVGSLQASLSCATDESNVPEGFVAIGQSVHSHPRTKMITPSPSDLAIQRMTNARGLPYKALEKNVGMYGFSNLDYAHGPGYLIAGHKVLHQDGGPRSVREVGKLETLAPIRHFARR